MLSRLIMGLVVCCASCATAAAETIVIDDFEYGALSVTDTTANDYPIVTVTTTSGLHPSHTVGEQRTVGIHLIDGPGPASVELSPDVPNLLDDVLEFTVPVNSRAGLNIGYDGGASLDLDLSGCDRFQIVLSAAPPEGSIAILLNDADGFRGLNTLLVSGPGTYDIPFANFSSATIVDFSNLANISTSFLYGSFGVAEIRAVPEPSAMQMLGTLSAALMGLVAYRKLRRSIAPAPHS